MKDLILNMKHFREIMIIKSKNLSSYRILNRYFRKTLSTFIPPRIARRPPIPPPQFFFPPSPHFRYSCNLLIQYR